MNLTTPRTHQYAVWVTIGFFEVKRLGDLGMFVYNPTLAFDIMGREIGASNGKSVRFRAFYLVDRLRLTGFNPSSPSGFRQAIVYRTRTNRLTDSESNDLSVVSGQLSVVSCQLLFVSVPGWWSIRGSWRDSAPVVGGVSVVRGEIQRPWSVVNWR